jgi:hypothetical protein
MMPVVTIAGTTPCDRLHHGLHLDGCDCATPLLTLLLMLLLRRGRSWPPACAMGVL